MDKSTPKILWDQKTISISTKRGCQLITSDVLKAIPDIKNYKTGILNVFLKHTSASLSINENCDPDVRADMETTLNRLVPEDPSLYKHNDEGPDDMPAHVKCSLVGVSHNIPIKDGKLALGTWQGIWILEHRDGRNTRNIVLTMNGMSNSDN